ncbi:5'-nucleotidase [Bacillus phage vB_BanS-Thrax3]|nr:5'-nucleotidase [Bacillus phage vB_BanS-Thrax3]
MLVTYTGKVFDYNNITKESICVEDMIHSISQLSRFVGHSSRTYTVGEHVLWCALMAHKLEYSPRLTLLTLIHDFEEAYMNDVPTPLKDLLPEYKQIAKDVSRTIYEYLEVAPPTPEEKVLVKRIDLTMLAIEMRDLTLHDYAEYVDENTYLEMLDDPEFNLKPNMPNVKLTLQWMFNILIDKYRNEEE